MWLLSFVWLFLTEAPYNETPLSYGYDLEHSEEHQPRHDPLSYTGSPSSSPRLRSKSRSSRDTQSSGSLESTLSVMLLGQLPVNLYDTSTVTLCSLCRSSALLAMLFFTVISTLLVALAFCSVLNSVWYYLFYYPCVGGILKFLLSFVLNPCQL